MDSRKELYNGSWVADNARAEMSSVCLNRKPSHCNYLSGLLELYRNKVRIVSHLSDVMSENNSALYR